MSAPRKLPSALSFEHSSLMKLKISSFCDTQSLGAFLSVSQNHYSLANQCWSEKVRLEVTAYPYTKPAIKICEEALHLKKRINALLLEKETLTEQKAVQATHKFNTAASCLFREIVILGYEKMLFPLLPLVKTNEKFPETNINSFVLLATFYGHNGVIDVLIQNDANILEKAAARIMLEGKGSMRAVRHYPHYILNAGANIVMVAAASGKIDCLRHVFALLPKELQISSINYQQLHSKQTALHVAALYGHLECTNFLIEKGADISLCDKENRTPLDVATNDACRQALAKAMGIEGKVERNSCFPWF